MIYGGLRPALDRRWSLVGRWLVGGIDPGARGGSNTWPSGAMLS